MAVLESVISEQLDVSLGRDRNFLLIKKGIFIVYHIFVIVIQMYDGRKTREEKTPSMKVSTSIIPWP